MARRQPSQVELRRTRKWFAVRNNLSTSLLNLRVVSVLCPGETMVNIIPEFPLPRSKAPANIILVASWTKLPAQYTGEVIFLSCAGMGLKFELFFRIPPR
ncbi:hypothetical protein V8E55_004233 [Tylopilus felleus]